MRLWRRRGGYGRDEWSELELIEEGAGGSGERRTSAILWSSRPAAGMFPCTRD